MTLSYGAFEQDPGFSSFIKELQESEVIMVFRRTETIFVMWIRGIQTAETMKKFFDYIDRKYPSIYVDGWFMEHTSCGNTRLVILEIGIRHDIRIAKV